MDLDCLFGFPFIGELAGSQKTGKLTLDGQSRWNQETSLLLGGSDPVDPGSQTNYKLGAVPILPVRQLKSDYCHNVLLFLPLWAFPTVLGCMRHLHPGRLEKNQRVKRRTAKEFDRQSFDVGSIIAKRVERDAIKYIQPYRWDTFWRLRLRGKN